MSTRQIIFFYLLIILFLISSCTSNHYNIKENEFDESIKTFYINAVSKSDFIFIGEVSSVVMLDELDNKLLSKTVMIRYKIIKVLYQKGDLNEEDCNSNYVRVFHNYQEALKDTAFKKDIEGNIYIDLNLVKKIERGKKYIIFIDKNKKHQMELLPFPKPFGPLNEEYFKYHRNKPRNVAFSNYGKYLRKTSRYTKENEKYIMNLIKEIKGKKDKNDEGDKIPNKKKI